MENNSPHSFLVIPKKYLLSVYLILPILLVVFLADIFFFNRSLLPYMGVGSMVIPLYLLFFELPHIIASFFGFADDEYMKHYKKQLFFKLPLLLAATALLLFVNFELGVTLYLIGTVWHGLKQQTGIALILGARPGWLHTLWTVIPVIITSLAYVYYMVPSVFPERLFYIPYLGYTSVVELISPIIFIGILFLAVITVMKYLQSPQKVRLYILCVSSLFFFSYIFILAQYIFLAFFAVRFIHDLSAFAFYITHDANRNAGERKNYLYRIFKSVPLPVWLLVPSLAVLFAYVARVTADGYTIGFSILVLLGMAHYYLESVMWKRDNLHRQFIKVE